MNLPRPLKRGRFVRRLNRFAAEVLVEGQTTLAHVPNSGRLGELLVEGASVYVHPASRPDRKTAHDLLLVRFADRLVSVDSRAPAAIAAEALLTRGVPPAPAAEELRREVPVGDSRIDLWLRGGSEAWLIEVKGCTLVADGTALFPDAPTARGRRHLEHLAEAVAGGLRAMALFVVQRDDACRFAPNRAGDPEFADALAEASRAGVEVAAYGCGVTLDAVELRHRLPVHLAGGPGPAAKEPTPCE